MLRICFSHCITEDTFPKEEEPKTIELMRNGEWNFGECSFWEAKLYGFSVNSMACINSLVGEYGMPLI